jgi:hypothetical protein
VADRDSAGSFTLRASERQLALLSTAVLLTGDHHRAEDLDVQDGPAVVGPGVELATFVVSRIDGLDPARETYVGSFARAG